MFKLSRISGFVSLIILLSVVPAVAQLAAVTGHVTGPDGKPVVGGAVVFQETDITRHYVVRTNKKGKYAHYGLPLGVFDVTAYMPDGKTVVDKVTNFHTHLGDPIVLDFNGKQAQQTALSAQTAGMTEEQKAAFEKEQAERKELNEKVGGLNALLGQETAALQAKQYPQALAAMQQAQQQVEANPTLAVNPAIEPIYANLARDYMLNNQPDKAVAAYQKAISLKPSGSAYIGLGNAYIKMNNTAAAIDAYDKAVQADPAVAKTAYYNEGVSFYNQGKMREAADALQKAVQADPTNANAWYYRGMALLNFGKLDEKSQKIIPAPGTVEAFQKSLELAPSGPNADNAKAALDTLTSTVSTTYKKPKKH
jgi:tetratricopeptide (TPR) repeat protein